MSRFISQRHFSLHSSELPAQRFRAAPSLVNSLPSANQHRQTIALKALALLLIALLCGWSSAGHADELGLGEQASEKWLLAKYDHNGDSVISAGEVSHKRHKMFSYMDDNADGLVTLAEYELLDAKKRALVVRARFTKLDSNDDGQLSNDEYIGYYGAFGALDLDGNGHITSQEMSEAKQPALAVSPQPKCFLWLCVRTLSDTF